MMRGTRTPKFFPKVTWYDISFLMFDLVCSLCSAVMGAFFVNAAGDHSCKFGIPLFLILAGVGNFVLSTFRFLYPVAGSLLQLQFNLGIIVYGSIVAFGNWAKVEFEDTTSPYFCNEVPYRSAVTSVIFFIAYYASGVAFYFCCCLWIYTCRRRRHPEDGDDDVWAYKYSSGYIYCSMHSLSVCSKWWLGKADPAAPPAPSRPGRTRPNRLLTSLRFSSSSGFYDPLTGRPSSAPPPSIFRGGPGRPDLSENERHLVVRGTRGEEEVIFLPKGGLRSEGATANTQG